TLVLGQWRTPDDPVGSATAEAVAAVSQEQQHRYDDDCLDLADLLTSEDGLRCPPLAPMPLLAPGAAQEALAQRIVPAGLRAPDDIHRNGWGNLAVSWPIVRRMRERRWLRDDPPHRICAPAGRAPLPRQQSPSFRHRSRRRGARRPRRPRRAPVVVPCCWAVPRRPSAAPSSPPPFCAPRGPRRRRSPPRGARGRARGARPPSSPTSTRTIPGPRRS